MGVTKLLLDIPDELRGGVYSNLGLVKEGEDGEAVVSFYLMDSHGCDEDGTPTQDGVLQSRVIMSVRTLAILRDQLDRYLDDASEAEHAR